ncbi:MAG: serine/threonine protein kinase, partial [Actinomycetota bacterium]|nr:serine/threonine protein kinase [Actinomycetota bacterium]
MARHGGQAGGAQLGPYTLLRRVGEGGMGVVHAASTPDGRLVAVKVLRPHIAGDDTGRARLAREVRVLRRVVGRNVAEVLDADVDAEPPYLVTRFVDGRPLDDVVREHGPLRGGALLRLARGLARALGDVHAAEVVHRDLKPGNVLLPEDGEPVVIDFGIARVADESPLTMTGFLVGTPGYLAPEIVAGADATPASDVHAWGATVAYAGTGRPPYGSGPLDVVLYNVTQGRPDLDGLPPALVPVVRAALSPDPRSRP